MVKREPWNEFQLMWFDPGGRTGWAWMVINIRAFSRPEHHWLDYIQLWGCDELHGTEPEILRGAIQLINMMRQESGFTMCEVGSEDFDLVQTRGSAENLLGPVRQNAILEWECAKMGVAFRLQRRNLRTSVTRERLLLWGFDGRFRKDEFAAMQHLITRVRMIKRAADRVPWRLNSPDTINGGGWDCACYQGKQCNLIHPQ